MNKIRVYDDILDRPEEYLASVLGLEFKTYDFGHCVFHGIAINGPSQEAVAKILGLFPEIEPTLTFFRKSPLGQVEPHYIHTDVDMGEWSALLYLNRNPPPDDGTSFWTHRPTGSIESAIPHERSKEGMNPNDWDLRQRVNSKFNRLVVFPSTYFHSRTIPQNWGTGAGARLVQVTFGKGEYK